MQKKQKVFVALSGGVDSSVAAAMLQKEGYDVSAVFIKVWQAPFLPCTQDAERRAALRVAAFLGIPFYTLDLSEEYKKEIVDTMVAEYKAGRTPNPDVLCNRYIKFGGFLKWAREHSADYIATGHHARTLSEPSQNEILHAGSKAAHKGSESVRARTRTFTLLRGVDTGKDQAYFLWQLTQEDLAHTLMPIGGMQKSDVRRLAKKFRLPSASKKDSQGLCFVGDVNMREFLQHFIETQSGDVLNEAGEKIGAHDGAVLYTIGQNSGLIITEETPVRTPYYVVAKDLQTNTLTVSHTHLNAKDTEVREVLLQNTNWINEAPQVSEKYTAEIRYHQKPQEVIISEINIRKKTAILQFAHAQEGIAVGQSVVVYDGEVCLGGGIIM